MQMKLDDMIKFSCKPVQQFYGQYDIMTSEFQRYMRQEDRVVVMVETATKKERIQAMLSEMHIPTLLEPDVDTMAAGHAAIIEGSLSEGFELPYMSLVVVTERELFKSKQKKSTKKAS